MTTLSLIALVIFCVFLLSVWQAWHIYLDKRNERETTALRIDVQTRLDRLCDGLRDCSYQVYQIRYDQYDHLFRYSPVAWLRYGFPSGTEWIWNGTAAKRVPLTEDQFYQWQIDPMKTFQIGQPHPDS